MPPLHSEVTITEKGRVLGFSTVGEVTVVAELCGEHWLPLYGVKKYKRLELPPCFSLTDEVEEGLTKAYRQVVP